MAWFFAVLIVLAIGAVVVVAAGRGEPLAETEHDRPPVVLPADRPLTGEDLRGLRLSTAVRGYRADEVDALLDRLAAQLDVQRDARDDAQTRSGQPPTPPGQTPAD